MIYLANALVNTKLALKFFEYLSENNINMIIRSQHTSIYSLPSYHITNTLINPQTHTKSQIKH